jgi:UDP-GlcNAc:undecaprenyl-phosphate GlcNAc-1-phosphate transferase
VLNNAISGLFELGAVLISWVIFANARIIGEKLHVIDHPDGLRKVHEAATPLVAGFGILIPLFLWCAATLAIGSHRDTSTLLVVVLCGLGATLVGYTDDQSSTSPSSRLLSILLFSVIALVLNQRLIPSVISVIGLGPLPIPYWFAFPLVAIALAGFVNAVNMADGQNGLAIGMALVWSGCIAHVTSGATSAVAQTMFFTTLTALVFNLAGLAFLGDSGTYGLGFVVGLLAIEAHNSWGVPAQTVCVWFFFPVLDCLRLIVRRTRQGRYPFGSDLDHFHHHLQTRLGRNLSLVVYLGAMAATSIISSLAPKLAPFCLISLTALYFTMTILPRGSAQSVVPGSKGHRHASQLHLVGDDGQAISEQNQNVGEPR